MIHLNEYTNWSQIKGRQWHFSHCRVVGMSATCVPFSARDCHRGVCFAIRGLIPRTLLIAQVFIAIQFKQPDFFYSVYSFLYFSLPQHVTWWIVADFGNPRRIRGHAHLIKVLMSQRRNLCRFVRTSRSLDFTIWVFLLCQTWFSVIHFKDLRL